MKTRGLMVTEGPDKTIFIDLTFLLIIAFVILVSEALKQKIAESGSRIDAMQVSVPVVEDIEWTPDPVTNEHSVIVYLKRDGRLYLEKTAGTRKLTTFDDVYQEILDLSAASEKTYVLLAVDEAVPYGEAFHLRTALQPLESQGNIELLEAYTAQAERAGQFGKGTR